MNPIFNVTIENFQSHKVTQITPARAGQMTVITGPSDAGKTAIIRALRWLLYNVPQGTDFIRHGASFARVTAEYASGHKVIRERSRSGYNRYIIVTPDGERQKFEGFGNNVPLEVQQITGVSPVVIGDMEFNLNLAEQLDGPFLGKSVSAGARAKVLGKLAGTEEVDHAARTLGTDLYRKRQEEKRLATEAQELEEKIQAYSYLEHLGDAIAVINSLFQQLKTDIELLNKLKQIAADIQKTRELADKKARIIATLNEHLTAVEPLLETVSQDAENKNRLGKLQAALTETRAALTRAKQTLTYTFSVDEAAGLVAQVKQEHENLVRFLDLAEKRNRNRTASQQAKTVIHATSDAHIVDTLVEGTQRTMQRYLRLTDLGRYLGDLRIRLQNTTRVLSITNQAQGADELINMVEQNAELFGKLMHIKNRQKVLNEALPLIQRDLDSTARAKVVTMLIAETEVQLDQFIKLSNKFSQLNIAKEMILIHKEARDDAIEHIQKAKQKYIDLLIRNGVCPTCGGSVTPEKLKEVI